MQDVAWIGRLALHTPSSCLEVRRKLLQVLLEVEGRADNDVMRCIPMASCVSDICR
ncbi:hypothetical protein [Rhodoferax sp.]|uniref:hypothetical protein n=1 Tax=Rhodoferax sp. TaxID=50421 RepID=UPI0025DE4F4D|nr:hypothetical protein [Rhodoferax sp.]